VTHKAISVFDIAPGKTLDGRYRVVRTNRQGGFSTAFEVEDVGDGSHWELQLFPGGMFERPGQAAAFRALLEPWNGVHCESVSRVREVLDIPPDGLALISELPQGESLRARLNRERRLSRAEVLALARRLLHGLVELHGRGLVHGDIKPYTIHVQGHGVETHPKLVDGGVTPGLWTAKDLGDKTTLIGTPFYAPIEQFGGDAPDVRSDVYNLATVLYEALCGVLPWAGKTFLEVFQSKLSDPPPMKKRAADVEVDPALEDVIRRGCLADRNRRLSSAEEFLRSLPPA
jgi:serine/threonine-protein kinase